MTTTIRIGYGQDWGNFWGGGVKEVGDNEPSYGRPGTYVFERDNLEPDKLMDIPKGNDTI